MLKIFTILSTTITLLYSQIIICDDYKPCEIEGNATKIIIASKYVPLLKINCIEKDQCKKEELNNGLVVYSSANTTIINCNGEDSCEEISCNFGITPKDMPNELFKTKINEIIISCLGKQSCKSINIKTINNGINKGLNIFTPNDAILSPNALVSSLIECNNNLCNIDCGNDIDTCKDTKCYGNCLCNPIESCPHNYNHRPTTEPTESPIIKEIPNNSLVVTPETTEINDENIRNTTKCEHNGCILTPYDYYDVICPNNINLCIVECLNENQCKKGVIIKANSNNVIIKCLDINSCDKMIVDINNDNFVDIEIMGDKAAENMIINVNNKLAKVDIKIDGKEAFSVGNLICNGECFIACLGQDSCKNTKFECLNTKNQCICSGDCPKIKYFGDSSCDTEMCVLKPRGKDRIVAPNNVEVLIIDCNDFEQQCKGNPGLKIYSAAKTTKILCNSKDSCENIELYIGELPFDKIPKGFELNDFKTKLNKTLHEQQTLEMTCDNVAACKAMQLYITGEVEAIIKANSENALQEATLICDDCKSLEYDCRDFDGCSDMAVLCPNIIENEKNPCFCNSIFVETEIDEVTEAPRNSCPDIGIYKPKQKGILAISSTINELNKHKNEFITIIMGIIGVLIMFGIAYIVLHFNKNKSIKNYENEVNNYMLNSTYGTIDNL